MYHYCEDLSRSPVYTAVVDTAVAHCHIHYSHPALLCMRTRGSSLERSIMAKHSPLGEYTGVMLRAVTADFGELVFHIRGELPGPCLDFSRELVQQGLPLQPEFCAEHDIFSISHCSHSDENDKVMCQVVAKDQPLRRFPGRLIIADLGAATCRPIVLETMCVHEVHTETVGSSNAYCGAALRLLAHSSYRCSGTCLGAWRATSFSKGRKHGYVSEFRNKLRHPHGSAAAQVLNRLEILQTTRLRHGLRTSFCSACARSRRSYRHAYVAQPMLYNTGPI